jgi:hypothetical protein
MSVEDMKGLIATAEDKSHPNKSNRTVIIAVAVAVIVVVAVVGLIVALWSPAAQQPNIQVVRTNIRYGWRGLSYVAYEDVSLINYGSAPGLASIEITFQEDTLYSRIVSVHLAPSESTTITEEFPAQYGYSGITFGGADVLTQAKG